MVRAGTGGFGPFFTPVDSPCGTNAGGVAGYVDPELAAEVSNLVPARWVESL